MRLKRIGRMIICRPNCPFSAGRTCATDAGGQPQAQQDGLMDKFKQAPARVKYTIAGGRRVGAVLNAATGNVPEVEAVIAKFSKSRTHQICASAGSCRRWTVWRSAAAVKSSCTRHAWSATLESYIGLVEVGVGGVACRWYSKEATCAPLKNPSYFNEWRGDVVPVLAPLFSDIAMGEVAKSAGAAREWVIYVLLTAS